MATSLQDLFSNDSPIRPSPRTRADSPGSPTTPAGPSKRAAAGDKSNPLFLSPGSSFAGTPARRVSKRRLSFLEDEDSPANGANGRDPLDFGYDDGAYARDAAGLERRRRRMADGYDSDVDIGGSPGLGADLYGLEQRNESGPVRVNPDVDDPLAGINLNMGNGRGEIDPLALEVPGKKRRVMAKIDSERLFGPRGFPALLKAAKKFKAGGKGREVKDLGRILDVYQLWAHSMFPKGEFSDTIKRVETVCHTRRMESAIAGMRDAFYPKPDDTYEDLDDDELDAAAAAEAEAQMAAHENDGSAPNGNGTAPQPLFDDGGDPDFEEMMAMEEMERDESERTARAMAVPQVVEEEEDWEGLYE